MAGKYTALTPALHDYLLRHGVRADELLERLAEETRALGDIAGMQVAPEQGALLTLLARTLGARRALELGTFTGYSAICIARGLEPDGRLVSCDVSEEWTAVARRYLEEAGLAERVDLRLGPALDTLRELSGDEPFDLAFIDADKPSYPAYWEECLRLVRPGGLVLVDNVFAGGGIVEGSEDGFSEESAGAIRALNAQIAGDERVEHAMVPIADGLTIARVR